jgi:putative Mg2+ transporter-C (MgtC) family protein
MDWGVELLDAASRFFTNYHRPILELMLAAALGGVVGLEREASAKPAGFRTHLLICVGAALLTQLSALVAGTVEGVRGDPGRIAAQIVSGIGFLGAGTIIQSRGSVTGLTTAATMWVVAAIGIGAGSGAYVHALVVTLLVMLALRILGRFEARLITRHDRDRTVRVVLDPRAEAVAAIEKTLMDAGYRVRSFDIEKIGDTLVASFETRGDRAHHDSTLRTLLARDDVRQVTLR